MAAIIEVKYFNSFWLKKVVKNGDTNPSWPGLPWNPTGYGTIPFPFGAASVAGTPKTGHQNFYVEESRIKGGFNNTGVDLGVRAYMVDDNSAQQDRSYSLIFSGTFNSRTGYNETNVFSVGEAIVKDLEPINGSIQKLYTEDTNLNIFQENKVSKVLINKNAMYAGAQGSQDTGNIRFLGQSVAYLGEYGISRNPESFAFYGFRKYFADKDRASILRLSRDGITEISSYGMRDYFRDYLVTISDQWERQVVTLPLSGSPSGSQTSFSVTSADCCSIEFGASVEIDNVPTNSIVTNIVDAGATCTITIDPAYTFGGAETNALFVTYTKGKIIGGWDIHNQNYIVSMQTTPRSVSTTSDYATAAFDEHVLGWTSFYTYKPNFVGSLKNKYYSFVDSNIYEHYYVNANDNTRGKFYGATSPTASSMIFIFNPQPSITKNFNTVAYEGANGWQVDYFQSDFEGFDKVDGTYQQWQDTTTATTTSGVSVMSYLEGSYDSAVPPNDGPLAVVQPIFHAGFNRKENRYVANLKNTSRPARPGEVISGNDVSGIKGYLATVKISTDSTTNPGGMKELFSVASNFVVSSY